MSVPRRLTRWCTLSYGLLLLTWVPLLAAVGHAWRAGWVPIGDHGLIELRAADVLTANHPWLGTWTSASLSAGADLNNPGPLLFDALAPFVKLFGGSIGAVWGVAVINGAASALTLWQGRVLAGRRGEVVMAAACLLLMWSMGSELLIDPWQPHVLMLPFLAFLACAAASAAGHTGSIAWTVGMASLLVQSHLSFTYLVASVGAVSFTLCWFSLRRSPPTSGEGDLQNVDSGFDRARSGQWRRPLVATGLTTVVCWFQPLYEQIFGAGEGNLSRLAGARGSSSDSIGAHLGTRLVARVLALPPWFLRPSFEESIPITPRSEDGLVHFDAWPSLPAALLSLALVGLVAVLLARRLFRSGERDLATLLVVISCAVGAAWLTMLLMPLGPLGLASHQMRWLWPISVMFWCAMAAGAVTCLPSLWWLKVGLPPSRRRPVFLGGLVVVCVISLPTYLTDSGPATFRQYRGVIASMMAQLETVHLDEPAQFDTSNLRFAEPFSGPALYVLLDNDQPVTVVDEGFVRQLGDGRRASGDERWMVQVLERDAALTRDSGSTLLAFADGLTGGQRDELAALEGSGADPARLEELISLRRSLMVAIVLIPLA